MSTFLFYKLNIQERLFKVNIEEKLNELEEKFKDFLLVKVLHAKNYKQNYFKIDYKLQNSSVYKGEFISILKSKEEEVLKNGNIIKEELENVKDYSLTFYFDIKNEIIAIENYNINIDNIIKSLGEQISNILKVDIKIFPLTKDLEVEKYLKNIKNRNYLVKEINIEYSTRNGNSDDIFDLLDGIHKDTNANKMQYKAEADQYLKPNSKVVEASLRRTALGYSNTEISYNEGNGNEFKKINFSEKYQIKTKITKNIENIKEWLNLLKLLDIGD